MSATVENTGSDLVVDDGNLDELMEREGRIERAMKNAFYEVGLELRAIRDRELYKVPRESQAAGRYAFVTFEEYVEERWEYGRHRALQLIDAADAVERLQNVDNCQHFPTRESHVRPLLSLETDEQRSEVWTAAVDRGEKITAKIVEEEVELFKRRLAKDWFTLDEWTELTEEEWAREWNATSDKTFNKQDTASIEWAQWSWNPVTGCKHDCPYCYARDIAQRFYPQKFEPSIYPARFWAPQNTKVPAKAEEDIAFKNVFTCSMADLFGRWVPLNWIESVMTVVAENPQWNFLFLTKFPQRFSEVEIPDNAWMGTTVDCQSRVANAEKAFAKLKGGIKWLSVEPMLTPLKFKKLEVFNWVVMGGASASTQSPAWVPPFDWVHDLHHQARQAGCAVYHKDNLGIHDDSRVKEFPWQDHATAELPEQLKYLDLK